MNFMQRASVDVVLASRRDVSHLSPVIREIRERSSGSVRIITIHELGSSVREMLNALDLSPDVCWTVRGTEERPSLLLAEFYMLLNELWSAAPATWLLNYGCSKFTYPCVSAAFQNNVSVAHLHDSDSAFKTSKQNFRLEKIVSTISDIHFTTGLNIKNKLIYDGVSEEEIYSVGSTMPDFGRDVLNYRILEQKVSGKLKEFLKKTNDKLSFTKVIAIEIDSSTRNFDEFASFLSDNSEFLPMNQFVYFSSGDHEIAKEVAECKSTVHSVVFSLSHWERCYLFTQSFCVLSKSSETIDEARSFGALGLLLKDHTKRLDLLSEGNVSLVGDHPQKWLTGLKTLATNIKAEKEFGLTKRVNEHSSLNASKKIAAVLTTQKDGIVQTEKT